MSLFNLLLALAVVLIAVGLVFSVAQWIYVVALVLSGLDVVVSVTNNDRRVG